MASSMVSQPEPMADDDFFSVGRAHVIEQVVVAAGELDSTCFMHSSTISGVAR